MKVKTETMAVAAHFALNVQFLGLAGSLGEVHVTCGNRSVRGGGEEVVGSRGKGRHEISIFAIAGSSRGSVLSDRVRTRCRVHLMARCESHLEGCRPASLHRTLPR
jgi:hypothetical protein